MVVENFPDSSDLYSEIGAVTRSAKVCAGHGGVGRAPLPQSWGFAPAISAERRLCEVKRPCAA